MLNGIYHNSSAVLRPEEKGSATEIALIHFGEKVAPREHYDKYRDRAA